MKTFISLCLSPMLMVVALTSISLGQEADLDSYQAILARSGYSKAAPNNVWQDSSHSNNALPLDSIPRESASPASAAPIGNNSGCDVGCATGGCDCGSSSCGGGCRPSFFDRIRNGKGSACNDNSCGPRGRLVNAVKGLFDRNGNCATNGATNHFFSTSGIFMYRDYESARRLSFNGSGGLWSDDAHNGTIDGLGVNFGQRGCEGRGWEINYWTLFEDQGYYSVAGTPYNTTTVNGYQYLDFGGNQVDTIFNNGEIHSVNRETELHNFELNILNNGGQYTTLRGQCANYELIGGFRWFNFDENYIYRTDTTVGGFPPYLRHMINIENVLLGLQVGARSESRLTDRIRLSSAAKVGLYNNYIRARQCINDGTTCATHNAGSYAGNDFDYANSKNDLAFLGEFNAGIHYMLRDCTRFTIGYRALSVSGVALSVDQIPYDFNAIPTVNSHGSLLLHGGYFGLEHSF